MQQAAEFPPMNRAQRKPSRGTFQTLQRLQDHVLVLIAGKSYGLVVATHIRSLKFIGSRRRGL